MDDRKFSREPRPSPKIYISNLNFDTSESDLRNNFSQFGTIVDINLKQKSNGIVFAFIEYDSIQCAEKALQNMNHKELLNKELKVEFARGGDRGDRGDRGGFRDRGSRGGFRDRGSDRRQIDGDRPKGCFNCHQEGHFARECPKPRQPREQNRYPRNRDRERGDREDRDGGRRNRDYRDRDKYRYRRRSESGSKSRSRSHDKKRKYRKRSSSNSSHS